MSEPLVLVILLNAGATDPTADAMMAATRKALGPEAIVLADMSMPATNRDALQLATKVGARAVARVTWADSSQMAARLHVHVAPASANEWFDDEITFQPRDVASEKGRTVGYALATMVQRIERDRAAVTAGTAGGGSVASSNGATASAPGQADSPTAPGATTQEAGAQPESGGKDTPPTKPPTTSPPSSSSEDGASDLDLFATATGAVGGAASSFGVGGGGRYWATEHIGFRLGVLGRFGSLEGGLSSTTLGAAAGPGFRVRVLSSNIELGLRTDIVVFQHAVRNDGRGSAGGGASITRSRFLGGLDLVAEGAWLVSSHLAFIVGFGGELAFGTTDVNVGAARVAEFPAIRGMAEAGGRFRF